MRSQQPRAMQFYVGLALTPCITILSVAWLLSSQGKQGELASHAPSPGLIHVGDARPISATPPTSSHGSVVLTEHLTSTAQPPADDPKLKLVLVYTDKPDANLDERKVAEARYGKLNGRDFDQGLGVQLQEVQGTLTPGWNGTITLMAREHDVTHPKQFQFAIEQVKNWKNNQKVFTFSDSRLSAIADQGAFELYAVFDSDNANEQDVLTDPVAVKIDTRGPTLRSVELQGGDLLPDSLALKGPKLTLEFDTGDFDPNAVKNLANYKIELINGNGTFIPTDVIESAAVVNDKNNLITLQLTELPTGIYRIRVIGTHAAPKVSTVAADGAPAGGDVSDTPTEQSPPVTTPLQDAVGNYAGGSGDRGSDQEQIFGHSPPAKRGEFVEFPEFQPTLPQPDHARRINPGDQVVTAVVRLFYFRDAHRVAQLINRTAESLNHAAVTLAERRAEQARSTADRLTDERRTNEREAVRKAEELRRAEAEVQNFVQLEGQLDRRAEDLQEDETRLKAEVDDLDKQISNIETKIENLENPPTDEAPPSAEATVVEGAPPPPAGGNAGRPRSQHRMADGSVDVSQAPRGSHLTRLPPIQLANFWQGDDAGNEMPNGDTETDPPNPNEEKIKKLEEDKKELEAQVTAKKERLARMQQDLETTQTQIEQIPTLIQEERKRIATLRNEAATANEKAIQSQAAEDRAREEQFRQEVAAAHEDPDTFAAGKLNSVDPVAQVSVSVIGEGLLQLRGPRKGIDKIRTLVHQIDAPLGQVKIEVITVQLNGERGDRMEAPVGRVEAHLGLGRFLTTQSLMLLRAAVQEEAARIAMMNDHGGHYQVDRDRKYLYSFFGRDFIDELYEMDSEFLYTENKLLGLHSMDTISLHQALFVLALARNDVRHQILCNFMEKVRTDLVQAEFDYRRSAEIFPFKTHNWLPHRPGTKREELTLEGVAINNQQRYHFRSLLTFFGGLDCASGETMNSTQRELLRLAQIFKSRMVAELELKQRVIERTMIEDDREFNLAEEEEAQNAIRPRVLSGLREIHRRRLEVSEELVPSIAQLDFQIVKLLALISQKRMELGPILSEYDDTNAKWKRDFVSFQQLANRVQAIGQQLPVGVEPTDEDFIRLNNELAAIAQAIEREQRDILFESAALAETASRMLGIATSVYNKSIRTEELDVEYRQYKSLIDTATSLHDTLKRNIEAGEAFEPLAAVGGISNDLVELDRQFEAIMRFNFQLLAISEASANEIRRLANDFEMASNVRNLKAREATYAFEQLAKRLANWPDCPDELRSSLDRAYLHVSTLAVAEAELENNRFFLQTTRQSLERRKLLDFLIEEQEEKVIDMHEGTRAHIASMDNYLKRLSIALEDDFKVQFYDPAFVRIRSAARQWDVTFSQVERTSILTNNRALAKVSPTATMEFDLPKRKIAIVEAFDAAQGLAQDYGALLQDPTFLAAFQMMGGGLPPQKVENVIPGLPTSRDEDRMGISADERPPTGSALQALVPDPAIYKFETGTGYEIRPVIQPDGNSIVYDFNYMYSTQIREPVQADEKHLGRIRRHFINTQVQTSNFELRELSRYQVALKAARTGQGVPLLQDIPGVGIMFRPLPSAESSIQQNIILAHSVVYPTLFDLMGLRWAPSVVDLNHVSVRDAEHVVRGRRQIVGDSVFDITTDTVDEILGLETELPDNMRRDLYHRQRHPSPYHPGGYTHPQPRPDMDPTGQGFERPDRRPIEMREPPYDRRFRQPIRYEEVPMEGGPILNRDNPQSRLTHPFGGSHLLADDHLRSLASRRPVEPGAQGNHERVDRHSPTGQQAVYPNNGAESVPPSRTAQFHVSPYSSPRQPRMALGDLFREKK